jgi:hypothetical protein
MTREPAPAALGPRHRIAPEAETVERDLARLALTVVELLRQLIERQAIRGSNRATSQTARKNASA